MIEYIKSTDYLLSLTKQVSKSEISDNISERCHVLFELNASHNCFYKSCFLSFNSFSKILCTLTKISNEFSKKF